MGQVACYAPAILVEPNSLLEKLYEVPLYKYVDSYPEIEKYMTPMGYLYVDGATLSSILMKVWIFCRLV